MNFTAKELNAVVDAVETAYYHLSRDGKHTSPWNWETMMAKLEKAYKSIQRKRKAVR